METLRASTPAPDDGTTHYPASAAPTPMRVLLAGATLLWLLAGCAVWLLPLLLRHTLKLPLLRRYLSAVYVAGRIIVIIHSFPHIRAVSVPAYYIVLR